MEVKATCENFKPSAQAAWICLRYIFPDPVRPGCQFAPFCLLTDDACPTSGLRNKPRSNYQPSDEGGETD